MKWFATSVSEKKKNSGSVWTWRLLWGKPINLCDLTYCRAVCMVGGFLFPHKAQSTSNEHLTFPPIISTQLLFDGHEVNGNHVVLICRNSHRVAAQQAGPLYKFVQLGHHQL